MIRKNIIVAFLLSTTFVFSQNVKFNVKYSDQLAVFVFIQNLTDNYPENVFKTEFQKSKYNTDNYKNIISKFDKLALDYSYSFDEFPYGSKIQMQTRDILMKNLVETTNLNEFKLRSMGIVPNKTLNDLTDIILIFKPIYNELIYNPQKIKFEKQLVEITQYAKENNLEKFFEMGLLFYNSSWDNSIPFQIAFYPLPHSESFTAQVFCNNFICAIPDFVNSQVLFSVMMHEAFHLIYDEQSLEFKNEIDNYFKTNNSKCSNYAYQIMDEVLATALGNGYVFEQLTGLLDANDWYYQQYINQLAQKIYPLVTEYVNNNKPIDKNFIDNYIKLYEENFPNWIHELDNIMTYRYVISENENDFNNINRLYRYHSSAEYETEITQNSIERMQKTPLTKVIIISKDHAEKLKIIKNQFIELKHWNYNANQEFTYKILLKDKSQFFIINQKQSSLEVLLKNMK